MKNIVLIAPPGAGKGTLTNYLVKKYGCSRLSTGNLIRKEIFSQSDLGKEIEKKVASGELIADNIVNSMILKNIKQYRTHIIFDGYPRSLEQARFLDNVFKEHNIDYDVIFLDVEKDILEDRILFRRICSKCGAIYNILKYKQNQCSQCNGELITRKDDNLESFDLRYKIYEDITKKALEFYKKKNKVIRINASSDIETIFKEAEEYMRKQIDKNKNK